MENREFLKIMSYQRLLNRIIGGGRSKASTIKELHKSKDGAIRITIVPLSESADMWLGGGISDFGEHPEDICEREFVMKLFPNGSHTMQYINEGGYSESVDCYSYSTLKIAYLSWRRKFDNWVEKNNISEERANHEFRKQVLCLVPENGYTIDRGAVLATLNLNDQPFIRLYVSVSGAQTGKVDEECALAGLLSGQKLLEEVNANFPNLDEHAGFSFVPDFVVM